MNRTPQRIEASARHADFDVFVSYSHEADRRLATAVQHALEKIGKSWRLRRSLRVYLDQTSMSLNPDLWRTVADVIARSRWFVLLASPEAAQSHWVNREVEEWLSLREGDGSGILPVLTKGNLSWDAANGDFDPTKSDSLPPVLVGVFESEPLYLDLRWTHTEQHLDLRNSRFRSALVAIAAPIHGIDRDELDSEDLRQHRRAQNLRRVAVTMLAVFALISGLLGVTAFRSANAAQREARQARAQAFSSNALVLVETDPAMAFRSAIEGYILVDPPLKSSKEALAAASANFRSTNGVAVHRLEHGAPVLSGIMSPDSRSWITGGEDGRVRFWLLEDGSESRDALELDGAVTALEAVSLGSLLIAAHGDDGRVSVWDLFTSTPSDIEIVHGIPVSMLAISQVHGVVVTGGEDGLLRRWILDTGLEVGEPIRFADEPVTGLVIVGDVLVAGADFSPIRRYDLLSGDQIGESIEMPNGTLALSTVVHTAPDGSNKTQVLINGDDQGIVRRVDLETGEEIRGQPLVEDQSGGIYDLAIDGNRILAGGEFGAIGVWYSQHPREGRTISLKSGDEISHGFDIRAIGVSSNGWMATSSDDPVGHTTLWHRPQARLDGPSFVLGELGDSYTSAVSRFRVGGSAISSIDVHDDNGLVAASTLSGRIAVLTSRDLAPVMLPLQSEHAVTDVAITGDADMIMAASSTEANEPAVKRWLVESGERADDLIVPKEGFLQSLHIDEQTALVVAAGVLSAEADQGRGLVAVWDKSAPQPLWWAEFDGWGLAVVSNNGTVWVGTTLGLIRGFDLTSGEALDVFGFEFDEVSILEMTPDGLILAAGFPGVVRFWDPQERIEVASKRIETPTTVTAVGLPSKGGQLIIGTPGLGARLWDLIDGIPIGPTLSPEWTYSAAVSEESRVLFGTPEGSVLLWDYEDIELACAALLPYETSEALELAFQRQLESCSGQP